MTSASCKFVRDPNRDSSNAPLDGQVLRKLLATAAGVELYTIPLYMSALYSIQGFRKYTVDDPGGSGSFNGYWPGMGPTAPVGIPVDPNSGTNSPANQRAFNAIFSVYIQEMFHLQLAGNLWAACCKGASSEENGKVKLVAPSYPPKSANSHVIPCIGDLKNTKDPLFHDVTVALDQLNENQIKLFMAIESPDWIVSDNWPKPPYASVEDVPDDFGSIGHLYEAIDYYLTLEYSDALEDQPIRLWDYVYDPDAHQVNAFMVGKQEDYPFPVTLDGLGNDPELAQAHALQMVDAIIDQGEGGSKTEPGVPDTYIPQHSNYAPGIQRRWDHDSHYERFKFVHENLQEVETWPTWLSRQSDPAAPFVWTDFLGSGSEDHDVPAQQQFGELLAEAYNNEATAASVDKLLSESFVSILNAMTACWNSDAPFPYAAMQALSSRVSPVWASVGSNGGTGPTFNGDVPPLDIPAKADTPYPGHVKAHACQGLNLCHGLDINHDQSKGPGEGSCALAVGHTCGNSNSCAGQGGCGYPAVPSYNDHNGKSPPNLVPSDPSQGAGAGGCGAPIPMAQVFHNTTDPKIKDASGNEVSGSVWNRARSLFLDRALADAAIDQQKYDELKSNPPKPTSLRVVLPPS